MDAVIWTFYAIFLFFVLSLVLGSFFTVSTAQVAVITRRPHGHFITHVEGANFPIVNGKALDVGESINGVQVVSIEPSNVVLACNGAQKNFKLK